MKYIFLIVAMFMAGSLAYGQAPVQVGWTNGTTSVTLAEAESNGVDLKRNVTSLAGRAVVQSQFQPISLVCSFKKSALENTPNPEENFEVKWYYYMDSRRICLGTRPVTIGESSQPDVVDLVSVWDKPRSGWWEAQIYYKGNGKLDIVQFAKQETFQILVK